MLTTQDVSLTPWFKGQICVEDEQGTKLRTWNLTSNKELHDFLRIYGKSTPSSTLLRASIIPIRGATFTEQAKYLLLPNFIHFALKIDSLIGRILASIIAIPIDLVTCVPRMVLYIFGQADTSPPHPLLSQLNLTTERAKLVKALTLRVQTEIDTLSEDTASQNIIRGTMVIALRILPRSVYKNDLTQTSIQYTLDNDRWKLEREVTLKYDFSRAAY